MRLAILGAFPFPVPQGSQVFAAQQARALGDAGAEVVLVCYGHGDGEPPADLEILRASRALSPRRTRAGFDLRKLVVDPALVGTLVAEHRRRPFDAVLAHNAEAAGVALAARAVTNLPVIYVAHTLWADELPSYGRGRLERPLAAVGAFADRIVARHSDAVLGLCREAADRLRPHVRGPLAVIPPGLEVGPPPTSAQIEAACVGHGLPRGGFVVYAGNVDRYQDLGALAAAARRVPELPFAIVTHDLAGAGHLGSLRAVGVASAAESRRLIHGAAVAVLPRRRCGGFPVKLLNYMEAGRAIVAYGHVADTLVDDESGRLLPTGAGAEALARAIRELAADPLRCERLGRGARDVLSKHHAWPDLAARTLEWVGSLLSRNPR